MFKFIKKLINDYHAKIYNYPANSKYNSYLFLKQNEKGKFGIYNDDLNEMLDLKLPRFFWNTDMSSHYYNDCWGSRRKAHFAVLEFLKYHEADYFRYYRYRIEFALSKKKFKKKKNVG